MLRLFLNHCFDFLVTKQFDFQLSSSVANFSLAPPPSPDSWQSPCVLQPALKVNSVKLGETFFQGRGIFPHHRAYSPLGLLRYNKANTCSCLRCSIWLIILILQIIHVAQNRKFIITQRHRCQYRVYSSRLLFFLTYMLMHFIVLIKVGTHVCVSSCCPGF